MLGLHAVQQMTLQQQAFPAQPGVTSRQPRGLPISSPSPSGPQTPASCHTRELRRPQVAVQAGRRVQDPVVAPVILPDGPNEEAMDLNSYMLRNRIVVVGQRINDQVATQVVASLLALDSLEPDADIKLYINCIAGSSYSVISILDTIGAISAPVSTVGFGMVGGNAVHVLAAGAKGKRFCMPNTRIMLQQPNGGAMGSADEVNIQATELNRTMKVMYQFLSKYTGLPVDRVEEECDRENFLDPKQAAELGLIDGVVPDAA
jgi:ATP-dependent Clp protease, protease subunit